MNPGQEDHSLSSSELSTLSELEVVLEDAIDSLWKSAVLIDEFNHPDGMNVLKNHLNKFSDSLLAVDSLAKKINVQIPIKVIEKVDEGKNPDIVTKEYFEDCRKKNDQARGRALCTKVFQEQFKSRLEAWNASLPVSE